MKMTAAEFIQRTKANPNWCSTITEPTEVTEYLYRDGSNIESLSPLITFSGKNENGECADFGNCKNLRIAEGTFHGHVNFAASGVERIRNLTITETDSANQAASFWNCKNLKIAEGTFPGSVEFGKSGIEKIGELHITKPDEGGEAVSFQFCSALKIAERTYPGSADFRESGIEKIINLEIKQPSEEGIAIILEDCKNLKAIRGKFNGEILAEDKMINEYKQHRISQKINRTKSKEPTLEL